MASPEYPQNPLERVRMRILERQQEETLARELFHLALDLLQERGKIQSFLRIVKWKSYDHLINSSEPPVSVSITADADLEKSKSVMIDIKEYGRTTIRRKGKGAGEKFNAYIPFVLSATKLDQLRIYQAALNQIATQFGEH